jgi:RNA polymerase sigma-70 factor (ECF subfamily)
MSASNAQGNANTPPEVAELVRRASAGEEEAFGELVMMYHERIYHAIYAVLGHREDAREIEQQTWVKAWRQLPRFRRQSGFYTWVYRIAVNTALDALRSRARRPEDPMPEVGPEALAMALAEHAPSRTPRPDRETQRVEFNELLDKALQQLSPEHRLVIMLREVEGLSYEDIAKAMGCRIGTVMSRIFYARRQLQKMLKDVL